MDTKVITLFTVKKNDEVIFESNIKHKNYFADSKFKYTGIVKRVFIGEAEIYCKETKLYHLVRYDKIYKINP